MPGYKATATCDPPLPSYRAFIVDDNGSALVEYALVLATLSALMFVVLGAIAAGVGTNLSTTQSGMTSWSGTQ